MTFMLDWRLEGDSLTVCSLELCEVRLIDDLRWPWLILVPRREGASEIHDLAKEDATLAASETAEASRALKLLTRCTKINTAAIGNVVSQLHIHVVARNAGDANWPGPVWGHGTRQSYGERVPAQLIADLAAKLGATRGSTWA